MDIVNEFLSVEGVRLETKRVVPDSAPPGRPTLLLLHEGLGCVAMWRDFPEQLAQRTGCPVMTYSRRGYGKSDPCELPRPVTYMHHEGQQTLPAFIAAARLDDYILVGHSDGASISLIHAGTSADKNLLAMVSMAPHVFTEEKTLKSIEQAKLAYQQGKLREALARYHGDNVDCAFLGWNGAWLHPDFVAWNIEAFLPGIQVPQLLIQAEDDPYGTDVQLDAIVNQSAGTVEVRLLPDCGHSPFRDQPESTLDAIVAFVNKIIST